MVGSASWRRVRLEGWEEDSASSNSADYRILDKMSVSALTINR